MKFQREKNWNLTKLAKFRKHITESTHFNGAKRTKAKTSANIYRWLHANFSIGTEILWNLRLYQKKFISISLSDSMSAINFL